MARRKKIESIEETPVAQDVAVEDQEASSEASLPLEDETPQVEVEPQSQPPAELSGATPHVSYTGTLTLPKGAVEPIWHLILDAPTLYSNFVALR